MVATDMVKPQALPRSADGKMKEVIIAFDVDGTLIKNAGVNREHGIPSSADTPILHQIEVLKTLSSYKNVIIVVWSGGGKQYAEMWGHRLGLDHYVWRYASKLEYEHFKGQCDTLIAIDDIQATQLGDINLIVREK